MNELYPVAKLGHSVLFVNKGDFQRFQAESEIPPGAVKVNFKEKTIEPVVPLEEHLKFNPWEELGTEERMEALRSISRDFSANDILRFLVVPLALGVKNNASTGE